MAFGFGPGEIALLLFVLSFPLIAIVWPAAVVLRKAGYPAPWAVLLPIPGVNIAAWFIFAFSEWPLEKSAVRFALDGTDR